MKVLGTHDLVSSQSSLAGALMFILLSEFLLVTFPFMGFLVDPTGYVRVSTSVSVVGVCVC